MIREVRGEPGEDKGRQDFKNNSVSGVEEEEDGVLVLNFR